MTNNQYCSPPVLRKMTLSFVIATMVIEELNVMLWPTSSPLNWGRLVQRLIIWVARITRQHGKSTHCLLRKDSFSCKKPTQNGSHYHFGSIPTMLPRSSLSYFWGVFLQNFNVSVLRAYWSVAYKINPSAIEWFLRVSCRIYSGTLNNWHRETSKCLLC